METGDNSDSMDGFLFSLLQWSGVMFESTKLAGWFRLMASTDDRMDWTSLSSSSEASLSKVSRRNIACWTTESLGRSWPVRIDSSLRQAGYIPKDLRTWYRIAHAVAEARRPLNRLSRMHFVARLKSALRTAAGVIVGTLAAFVTLSSW